jgi:hypothetical protein
MVLTTVIAKAAEGGSGAHHPETSTTNQDSCDQVISMLLEATELYLEEFPLAPHCSSVMSGFEIALSELPRRRHFEDADKKAPRFHEGLF